MNDPCHWILEFMGFEGIETAECFRTASDLPPITTESLGELDMPRIINNPKLRHDCNFDRELHFRPNLDGAKGKQKIKIAADYWKALEGELFVYGIVHQRRRDPQQTESEEHWRGILMACQKRLPKVFHTIRDILKSLVPDVDQKAILDRLDVELIMQEILNGMCDLIDLGNWLAKILKNHCAPMRDVMVDAMQVEIKRGASEEKPGRLVNGIRQLLNILEAMKLDVANHQIRHMRPLLIEDTFNFQRKYNAHRIEMAKIDVAKAWLWLEDEINVLWSEGINTTRLSALTSGLLKSVIFEQAAAAPGTFYLDNDRLRSIRTDLHTVIYLNICRDVFYAMAATSNATTSDLAHAAKALDLSVSSIAGISCRFSERMKHIAAEIMRLVLALENRSTAFDATLLDHIEQHLETDFYTDSSAFQTHAQALLDRLLPKLKVTVKKHSKLGALQLQDALLPPPPPINHAQPFGFGAVLTPVLPTPSSDPDDEFVRRLTHVIVLHWQIFADLVYDSDIPSGPPTRASPPSNSSTSSSTSTATVPVAQAVYGPGKKWLPIAVTVAEVPTGLPTPAASPAPEAPGSPDLEQNDAPSTEQAHATDPAI